MIVLTLTAKNKKKIIAMAAEVLEKGGVVVYPTETAYGLGADLFNFQAIKKIYQIKSRNLNKHLSVIAASLNQAKELVEFNDQALELAQKYWPGALTLVLENQISNKYQKLKFITKEKKIAIRVSGLSLARDLARELGRPITATSANVSGQPPCYSVSELLEQFNERKDQQKKYQPDLIIDAGELKKNKPSTIIQVEGNKVKVLRKGAIKIKCQNRFL